MCEHTQREIRVSFLVVCKLSYVESFGSQEPVLLGGGQSIGRRILLVD